jgi:UDP-N-acetylglucosamine transferase subunit ALG13
MIFVTLGTCPFQFDRLIKLSDQYAAGISEPVFVQRGFTRLCPENCEHKDFLTKDEYVNRIKDATVLIAHAGFGVALTGLKLGKRIVLVPRCSEIGEHTDNHQHELASMLGREGRVVVVDPDADATQFSEAVEKAKRRPAGTLGNKKEMLVRRLSEYVNTFLGI